VLRSIDADLDTWRSSLHTGVTRIQLTQRAVTSPEPPPLRADFCAGVNVAGSPR
jgi:hypothetical protein